MWGRLTKFFESLDAFLSLWGRAFGWLSTIGVGFLSAWGATASELLAAYAPYSYIVGGLLGAALFALILNGIAWFRVGLARGAYMRAVSRPVNAVNPLDSTFTRHRIKLEDFVDPGRRNISEKTFDNCDLVGPATILLTGCHIRRMTNKPFLVGSDVISMGVYPDGTPIRLSRNLIVVSNCVLTDCTIVSAIILLNSRDAQAMGYAGDVNTLVQKDHSEKSTELK